MTYPGLVLLVGVGVGLATFLYYMFTETNHENERQQPYNYHHSSRQSTSHDNWNSRRSESGLLNKRGISNSTTRRENFEDYPNSEDLSECTICLDELIIEPFIQLECGHKFHKNCLKKMKQYSPMLPSRCPICRRVINHAI